MDSAVGARLPLSARAINAASSSSPRRRLRPPPPRATGPHASLPPRDRLRVLRRECVALDRELKVLENSGHSRIGVFARPLVTDMQTRAESRTPQTKDVVDGAAPEADDECRDPFFHQFYDDEGRSLFEQLLRARMRGLAIAKLAYGSRSMAVARAEVELAEAYSRLNLWKQGYPHVMAAKNILQTLSKAEMDSETAKTEEDPEESNSYTLEADPRCSLLSRALAYFYELQSDEAAQGQVGLASFLGYVQLWQDELEEDRHAGEDGLNRSTDEPERSRLFDHDSLVQAFDASPSIHWQALLIRLEQDSASMRDYLSQVERTIQPVALEAIRAAFDALSGGYDSCVSHSSFLAAVNQRRLQTRVRLHQQGSSSRDHTSEKRLSRCLRALTSALKHKQRQVDWPTLAWSEVIELGCAHPGFLLDQSGESDPCASDDEDENVSDDEDERQGHLARILEARIDLFLSRVLLRRGQPEDAVRSIHLAIAAQERTCEDMIEPGDTLVPFYLAATEILAMRSKQLRARSHQAALDQVERWLLTSEGTRSIRARALAIVDVHCQRSGGQVLAKKDAESQASAQLRQERIAAAVGSTTSDGSAVSMPPDALALLDEAVEYCNKAWSLLEQHLGREHVATAAVHVALAQLHLTRGEPDECVRCYARAAAVYEAACNGPVPASALVQLEIARVHHQRALQLAKESESKAATSALAARRSYLAAGEFFQSFGREFPGVSSTRRECCALALDTFRQWLVLVRDGKATGSSTRQPAWANCSLDEQREVLARVHEAAVDGYGEFSIEASDAARELAKTLLRLGGAANASAGVMLLRLAVTVYESHFGSADRRTKLVRKEVQDMRRSLLDGGKEDEIDGGDWLTL
jgi:hypothetical protein